MPAGRVCCPRRGATGLEVKAYEGAFYRDLPVRDWSVMIWIRRPRYQCDGHSFLAEPDCTEAFRTKRLADALRRTAARSGARLAAYDYGTGATAVAQLMRDSVAAPPVIVAAVLAIDTKRAGKTQMLTRAVMTDGAEIYPDVIFYRNDDDYNSPLPTLEEAVRRLFAQVHGIEWVTMDFDQRKPSSTSPARRSPRRCCAFQRPTTRSTAAPSALSFRPSLPKGQGRGRSASGSIPTATMRLRTSRGSASRSPDR